MAASGGATWEVRRGGVEGGGDAWCAPDAVCCLILREHPFWGGPRVLQRWSLKVHPTALSCRHCALAANLACQRTGCARHTPFHDVAAALAAAGAAGVAAPASTALAAALLPHRRPDGTLVRGGWPLRSPRGGRVCHSPHAATAIASAAGVAFGWGSGGTRRRSRCRRRGWHAGCRHLHPLCRLQARAVTRHQSRSDARVGSSRAYGSSVPPPPMAAAVWAIDGRGGGGHRGRRRPWPMPWQ